jgi:mycothiol synthase
MTEGGSSHISPLAKILTLRRFIGRQVRKLIGVRGEAEIDQQNEDIVQLVWPSSRLVDPPAWTLPPAYSLRFYQAGDELAYFTLMERAGYPGWTLHEFGLWLQKALPTGFFMAFDRATGQLAATAMACHNPTPLHPLGGSVSCVATDPDHRCRGLGYAVAAAATCRLVEAGYREIYMLTDDWRLGAIKIYLRMGWQPHMFRDDMPDKWRAVCESIHWPYTPELWASRPPSGNVCLPTEAPSESH